MEKVYDDKSKVIIKRSVFGFILLSLIYHYISHTLIHQLEAPVFSYAYVDPIYILFRVSGFAAFIVNNQAASLLVDIGLFVSTIGAIAFPKKSFTAIVFAILYLIYFVIYNYYGMHHAHTMVGILLISIPFCISDSKKFTLLWLAVRYYTVCLYFFAFIWKLVRHSWFSPNQLSLMLKENLASYIYFNPDTFQSAIYKWFLVHPSLLLSLHILAVSMEGVFIIGFFTRRFDYLLIAFGILLHIGTAFFVDAFFFEIYVLYFTLVKFPFKTNSHHSALPLV